MQLRGEPEMTKESTLSSLKLRQLLIDLKEHGPNTCVRVRLLGEMWRSYFMRVVGVSEERVLFNDEVKNKLYSVPLNAIMQIELDHKFKEYQPHNHYTIQFM
ncbi:MAG TPA: hypothetical protein VGD40_13980 [Chryseosolibacter sp.]